MSEMPLEETLILKFSRGTGIEHEHCSVAFEKLVRNSQSQLLIILRNYLHWPKFLVSHKKVQYLYQVTPKKFKPLVGCGIKMMRPIFKNEMLINQSKANLDEKYFFGKIKAQKLEKWL